MIKNNDNYISFSGNEISILNPYDYLSQEDADKILIYLGINPITKRKSFGSYEILNTPENYKRVANVEIVIKKILKMEQKIAEEFVNSFINDKSNV